jgi:hypothetical protein
MTAVLTVALALAAAGAGAQETKKQMSMPDFSGEWVLNLDKSGFEQDQEGRQRLGNAVSMTVKQEEKELVVTRLATGRDGKEIRTTWTYSLKGKKTKNKTDFGTMESTAKWIEEGTVLEIVSSTEVKREGLKFTVETVQTWSIADDVITIYTVRKTPRGELKSTAVYERKGAETKAEGEQEEKQEAR